MCDDWCVMTSQLYHVYVLLEDSVEARFTFRHCMRTEAVNSSHTYFRCPNEGQTVILPRPI
jgi:hypothetical protein